MYKTEEMEWKNRSIAKSGKNAYNWKGGRKISDRGYVLVLKKDHHRASKSSPYVFEHILVMEEHLGRKIKRDEAVHHINGIKDDNRIENLEVMGFGEHTTHHHTGMKRSKETRRKISRARKRYLKEKELKESV